MRKNRGELWWGYLDDERIIHVKRYISDTVIRNYESLPMVKGIFDPFVAIDYDHAKVAIYKKYREMN